MPYKDPEKAKAHRKAYYRDNRAKHLARSSVRYEEKKEEIKAYSRSRYAKIRHLLITGEGKGHGKGKEFQKGRVPWNAGTRTVGYKAIATPKGMRSEHRVVMEKSIGRELSSQEVVHHWDEDKLNNDRKNLGLFRHSSAHSRLHSFADRHSIPIESMKFEQGWIGPDEMYVSPSPDFATVV